MPELRTHLGYLAPTINLCEMLLLKPYAALPQRWPSFSVAVQYRLEPFQFWWGCRFWSQALTFCSTICSTTLWTLNFFLPCSIIRIVCFATSHALIHRSRASMLRWLQGFYIFRNFASRKRVFYRSAWMDSLESFWCRPILFSFSNFVT